MEDSFFGFDTSAPLDDGGGRIAEPSEDEYDALNDETFGSAINGDWEEAHESMVRMGDGNHVRSNHAINKIYRNYGGAGDGDADLFSSLSSSPTPSQTQNRLRNNADSDLELNLSGMRLDDVDVSYDDSDMSDGAGLSGVINLDPSVWASQPLKPTSGNQNIGGHAMGMFGPDVNASRRPVDSNGINPSDFLRENFPSPFQQIGNRGFLTQQQHMAGLKSSELRNNFGLSGMSSQNAPTPKICTLEDIERNIIIQQSVQKQQQQHRQAQQQAQPPQSNISELLKMSSKTPTATSLSAQQQQKLQTLTQQQQQTPQNQQHKGPPGFANQAPSPPRPTSNFAHNMAQHPLSNLMQPPQQQQQQQQQQHQQSSGHSSAGNHRMASNLPLGFPGGLGGPHAGQLPPHPLLNHQHGLPPAFAHSQHRPLPNHPHLPIALNNFAMHPNFNAMRAAAAAAGIHPAALIAPHQCPRMPPHPPNAANMQQQQQQQFNMFNMRLVQEIQQNHPMLQNVARHHMMQHPNAAMGLGPNGHIHHMLQQHQHQQMFRGNNGLAAAGMKQPLHSNNNGGNNRRDTNAANGNLPPEEFDEYANLMSTRDKHWLIGIQLSQLNTDTPYIDDFYYTVYRERKAQVSGSLRHSQAHKDNQLNHPLTQPRGHAQLILVQLGNKNGTRNGQHNNRERRNSESANNTSGNAGQDQKAPYVFTPLKFENSLGKLQYGSVTAPRKIIDADIMSGETVDGAAQNDASDATSSIQASGRASVLTIASATPGDMSLAQRKSRHILLHIETMYRYILKLEDLDNPHAIATIIMKKKKESERIAALEQLENANKTPEERAAEAANPQSMNPALKNKFAYEIESKEALLEKIVAGLAHDKIVAMINVRKGKTLLRRIMPYIEKISIRWNVWVAIFSSLQIVVKKDREDTDGNLYALYPEFKKHIKYANFADIVRISSAITLNDKKSNGIFCSKFGLSSLVCLILQAEQIYVKNNDDTLNDGLKENWRQFLDQVANSLNRTIQNQTICAAIESDSIQPMMDHFARFKDLKLDALLELVTEAKQQIN